MTSLAAAPRVAGTSFWTKPSLTSTITDYPRVQRAPERDATASAHVNAMHGRPIAFILIFAAPSALIAAEYPEPRLGHYVIRGFRFASSQTLSELWIQYRTVGTPHVGKDGRVDNAVLILHGTTGESANFLRPEFAGELFGKGQPLDAARYFLILPDGIGHGGSSKPSDGLRARFPTYGYRDMITAQYRLVTEGLKIDHLRLVMGTSMGGMHTWLWGERYPEFMDALMPLAALPTQISGRNRVWRRVIIDAIRNDPAWEQGEYRTQPPSLRTAAEMLFLMGSNPVERQKDAPTRAAADRALDDAVARSLRSLDANNVLYALESSADYDPGQGLELIKAPLLAINSEDDLINPPELGILEREIRRVRLGRAIIIPRSNRTHGHGTHTLAALWKERLAKLLEETERESNRKPLDPLKGSLPKNEAQAIYSPDPADPWNTLFHALFTRTVTARLSDEFAASIPAGSGDDRPTVTRVESGDRAIEPLDPWVVHFGNRAQSHYFTEPDFSAFQRSLAASLSATSQRPALARALMQADLWAAHDILFASGTHDEPAKRRKAELLKLLARLVKKLALTPAEIGALPDNYAASGLPIKFFEPDSDWIEAEHRPERAHDHFADDRRAARVFFKPTRRPRDRAAWLASLRGASGDFPGLEATALIVQLLLIDTNGAVVPTKLTYEVQVRTFSDENETKFNFTQLEVAELSRRKLLVDRDAGGLQIINDSDAHYLPLAGNDYGFASSPSAMRPLVVSVRKRCENCHGENVSGLFTAQRGQREDRPIRLLATGANEHARLVAHRKMERDDFKALINRWNR